MNENEEASVEGIIVEREREKNLVFEGADSVFIDANQNVRVRKDSIDIGVVRAGNWTAAYYGHSTPGQIKVETAGPTRIK